MGDGSIGQKVWRPLRPLALGNRKPGRCLLPYSTLPFNTENERRGVVMATGKKIMRRLPMVVGHTAVRDPSISARAAGALVKDPVRNRLSEVSV